MLAAALVAVLILVVTLVISPAEGDWLSGLLPEAASIHADGASADICIGGIACEDGHALAFLALGVFASVHVASSPLPSRRLRPLVSLVVALVAFAALDEWAQGWAGRDPSMSDWIADVIGVFLGVLLGSQLTRVLLRR